MSEDEINATNNVQTNNVQSNIDELLTEVDKLIDDDTLTSVNVSKVMVSLMVLVDEYHDLSGTQKKEIILAVLRKYVIEHFEEEAPEYVELLKIIETVLPTTIDLMISIDNKEITIHLKKGCAMACPCLFQMLNRQKKPVKKKTMPII